MIERPYLSNISPAWPIERQRQLIGTNEREYADILRPAALKRRDAADLKERAGLLAPTGRRASEVIVFADWPCIAWDRRDLGNVIVLAHQRNATLRAVATGQEVAPSDTAAVVALLYAFSRQVQSRGLASTRAQIAESRKADTVERAKRIADDWGKPDAEFSTATLLARAGIKPGKPMAAATAKRLLGKRSKAQQLYAMRQAQEAGRAAGRAKRAKGNADGT